MATAIYFYNKKWGVFFYSGCIYSCEPRDCRESTIRQDIIGGALIGVAVAYIAFYFTRKVYV